MKRRLAKLVVFLLLGAIVNVAVAWGCALWINLDEGPTATIGGQTYGNPRALVVFKHERPGATRYRTVWAGFSSLKLQHTAEEILGPWEQLVASAAEDRSLRCIDVRGWPKSSMFSLVRRSDDTNSEGYEASHGVYVEPWAPTSAIPTVPNWRVLPLHPLFPGFAINTIFYAAILWLLFAAPFKVRRWRRIRRGQCPACGYPVGASETCTECGGKVSPRPSRARPWRVRSAIKWTCTVLTVLLIMVWISSGWYLLEGATQRVYCAINAGRITVARFEPASTPDWGFLVCDNPSFRWWFHFDKVEHRNDDFVAVPIWFFALLTAVPATVTFRCDRTLRLRERAGQCPACAYPVGTSPVCSECGAAVQTQKAETQKAEMTA